MEDARIVPTGEPITGEDLWYMDNVKSLSYECLVCKLACRPISTVKDVNKQRPHFRIHTDTSHEEDCPYGKGGALSSSTKNKSTNRQPQGRPEYYPSRFVLPRKRKIIDPNSNTESNNLPRVVKVPATREKVSSYDFNTPRRDYKTESFRMLVNHYLKFPQDRDLPLEAESIDGNTYRSCFHSLFTNDLENLIQPKNKIYYGPIPWKRIDFSQQVLAIKFSAGQFAEVNGKKHLENPFYLEFDTSSWSERVLGSFTHDFEKSRKDAIDSKGSKKALLFFIGEQDQSADKFRFFGIEPQLIAIKVV